MDRLKNINRIRKKLKKGDYTIGTWMQLTDSSVAEILGKSGYDWVAVDLEHGSISINQLPNIFRAIELGSSLPLARIEAPNPVRCKQALDAGAGGIIVPMIENASQLLLIKEACCWPPAGKRGVGFSRANLFGQNFEQYRKEAQSPILVAQIENMNAVKNLEEILKVKGLDSVMIGPYDLSASMEITAEFNHPSFIKILKNILELCKKHNVPCGYHVVTPDLNLLKKQIKSGYQFLAYSTDGVFLNTISKIDLNK